MKTLATILALALSLAPAGAAGVKIGDLVVDNAWARATPKGSQVGAGYLTIRNDGAAPDRLTGVAADFATVEVHEMKTAGGVMEMRELTGGVDIPAHSTVKLQPGGVHLMFVGLKAPLVKGETAKATLTFEHSGSGAVELPILSAGASSPGGAMKSMEGM